MLVERRGGRVLIHSSPPENMKVTTPFDLRVAELLLARARLAARSQHVKRSAPREAELADAAAP